MLEMYRVYEYEATRTCPECSGQETVPVAAYVNEETGKETVLAKRVRCERHGGLQVPCKLSKPIGTIMEIRMKSPDAYDYMVEKIRSGYGISHIER